MKRTEQQCFSVKSYNGFSCVAYWLISRWLIYIMVLIFFKKNLTSVAFQCIFMHRNLSASHTLNIERHLRSQAVGMKCFTPQLLTNIDTRKVER